MKITTIIVAAALAFPAAANAQSLDDTHERVWHPAGKIPALTYRPRDKSMCATRLDDRRADKGQAKRCLDAAEVPAVPLAAR